MPITGRFDADFTPFLDAVQQANKSLDGLNAQAKEMNTSMDRIAAGKGWVARIAEADLLKESIDKAGEAVITLGEHLGELVLKGAVFEDIEAAFDHLATQAGLAADVLLGQLRAGVHGTIDDFDLMKRANENMAAGLNLSEAQFKVLADGAYALAKATGTDTAAALDKMSDAMVTGRTKGIALLTGKLDLKAAEAEYAKDLIGTGRELTAEGKLEVDREAILARVQERLEGLGAQHENLDDKLKQAETAWSNFELQLGKVIAKSPVLASGLDTIRDGLINAFGGTQEAAIKNIASAFDSAAIVVVDFGLAAVETARVIHTAWSGIEVLVLGVETVLAGAVDTVIEGWTALAQGANAVSSKIVSNDTVATMVDVRTQVRGMTVDLAAQTAEAARGVVGASEFDKTLDKIGGTLFTTRDAMLAAKVATDAHTEAAGKNVTATDAAGESQKKLGEQLPPATEFTKQFVAAWDDLNKAGTDYASTVAAMDPALVQQIEYYLRAGASLKTLADAYPAVSQAQITAIDTLRKNSEKAALDVSKLWNEYNEIVGTGGESAYERAGAAIDKWYEDDVAKHQASKTDTAAYYEAISALDDAKHAKLLQNTLESDRESKASLDKRARDDDAAYQFALANQDQFSQQHIEKLRVDAEKSRLAAEGWGLGWDDAGKKAKKAVDDVDDSMKKVTDDTHAAADARNSFSFAGGAGVGDKFKGMSQEAMRLAGYIDLDGKVTAVGEAAGLGDSGGPIRPRASGGPVTAGNPYLVGEAGPELFVPSTAGAIVPNGGGGLNVVVNVNGSVLGSPDAIARAVGGAFMAVLKSQGTRLPLGTYGSG